MPQFLKIRFASMKGSGRWRGALLAVACASLLIAQDSSGAEPAAERMKLTVGKSVVLARPGDIARVSIGNPEVIDAVAVNSREILVNAKSLGYSSLVIWQRAGEPVFFTVAVEPNLEPVRLLLHETFPGESIDIRSSRDALSLIGHVSSQSVADRALALAAPFSKTVVSNLQVAPGAGEKQIILRVRFAELNRVVETSFGLNLLSTGALNTPGRISTGQFSPPSPGAVSGVIPATLAGAATTFSIADALNIFAFRPDLNLGAIIRDLETQGLLQILAEPNLVTTNGKEASFLVGGEFPVPILQGGASAGAITVQFREYGIRVSFLPLITPHHTIRMHVKPEVSTIDVANGVVFSGFTIPALATRRIETDVELGEGQSFVIGGLLDQRVTESLSRLPGLSSIPILGALFKSRSINKNKTELIVMVTPELITPRAPGDQAMPPIPREFLRDIPLNPKEPRPEPRASSTTGKGAL
ncbi:MAG: pilus assembly protein N-terminal domain-containing protein [Candidatus Solibacter usitatus]|nr:pilus assembly protein N-terminal domain-containing protein [Candidatus Solibacter usitatus]